MEPDSCFFSWFSLLAKKIQPPFKPSVVSSSSSPSCHNAELFLPRNPYWTWRTLTQTLLMKKHKTPSWKTHISARRCRTSSKGSRITLLMSILARVLLTGTV